MQVPSGLPQSVTALSLVPAAPSYGTHDQAYYDSRAAQFPAYLQQTPRPSPGIISYTPSHGPAGTKVTLYFQSLDDFDRLQATAVIMFGQRRCESILTKTAIDGQAFQYSLSTDAPLLASTNSLSPQVPLHLVLGGGDLVWESPTLEFGSFTYTEPQATYYQLDSPQMSSRMQPQRKRKLSVEASPRRSPTKKASMNQLTAQGAASASTSAVSSFRRPSLPDAYNLGRRSSSSIDYQPSYNVAPQRVSSAQYYAPSVSTAVGYPASQSPSWSYQYGASSAAASPSVPAISTSSKSAQILPSPGVPRNPPLIRTSTLQQSPTTPASATPITPGFNPYAIYPSNSKAPLKIEGDLNSMADKWSSTEWEASRRLVQFRRSQSGSVITATFEPVTLEDRIPNSICVSCIWWEEKQECYVTSVDTISLLEALVAVRFTVEEKNRIRRNLEGFRPATVSKTKADSEEFFKLIMGFPNPKPRNIEKDVKVFPWRILARALTKIIGKYASPPFVHMHHARFRASITC